MLSRIQIGRKQDNIVYIHCIFATNIFKKSLVLPHSTHYNYTSSHFLTPVMQSLTKYTLFLVTLSFHLSFLILNLFSINFISCHIAKTMTTCPHFTTSYIAFLFGENQLIESRSSRLDLPLYFYFGVNHSVTRKHIALEMKF